MGHPAIPCSLVPVNKEDKEILRNLLEKYIYEFTQYEQRAVNRLGLFGYDYLDNYWTESNRWAFFIRAGDELAGFAMVNDFQESPVDKTDYTLAEFFVMYKYRRQGIGHWAATALFDRFPGLWQLKCHPLNVPALHFWQTVVSEYSGGDGKQIEDLAGTEYPDGSSGVVFVFRSRKDA